MFLKIKAKIDQFYFILSLVLVVIAVVVALTLKSIFAAVSVSGEIDSELLQRNTPRIDQGKLDEAYEAVVNLKGIPLDL